MNKLLFAITLASVTSALANNGHYVEGHTPWKDQTLQDMYVNGEIYHVQVQDQMLRVQRYEHGEKIVLLNLWQRDLEK